MAAPRREIELSITTEELAQLQTIARSRKEPASRVERARILLAYREAPSCYAVGKTIGVTHQTVERCLARAVRLGVLAALDDSPRPGREPVITSEAKAWLVELACRKPKELGYPHELWTTRLLAQHVREHGPGLGHDCLARLAQGTVCKILDRFEIKPHKVRYYLERRDPEFEPKKPTCSASIVRSRRCERRRARRTRSPSSRTTRNPASRRSAAPRRTCRRGRTSMPAWHAITSMSGMARCHCWPASIC